MANNENGDNDSISLELESSHDQSGMETSLSGKTELNAGNAVTASQTETAPKFSNDLQTSNVTPELQPMNTIVQSDTSSDSETCTSQSVDKPPSTFTAEDEQKPDGKRKEEARIEKTNILDSEVKAVDESVFTNTGTDVVKKKTSIKAMKAEQNENNSNSDKRTTQMGDGEEGIILRNKNTNPENRNSAFRSSFMTKAKGKLFYKKKGTFSKWKLHFIVLDDSRMQMNLFKSQEDYEKLARCKQLIDIRFVTEIKSQNPKFLQSNFPFRMHRRAGLSTIKLAAHNEDERARWITAIEDIMKKIKISSELDMIAEERSSTVSSRAKPLSGVSTDSECPAADSAEQELIKPKRVSNSGFKLNSEQISSIKLRRISSEKDDKKSDKISVHEDDEVFDPKEKFGVSLRRVHTEKLPSRTEREQSPEYVEFKQKYNSLSLSRQSKVPKLPLNENSVCSHLIESRTKELKVPSPHRERKPKEQDRKRSPSPNIPLSKAVEAVMKTKSAQERVQTMTDDKDTKLNVCHATSAVISYEESSELKEDETRPKFTEESSNVKPDIVRSSTLITTSEVPQESNLVSVWNKPDILEPSCIIPSLNKITTEEEANENHSKETVDNIMLSNLDNANSVTQIALNREELSAAKNRFFEGIFKENPTKQAAFTQASCKLSPFIELETHKQETSLNKECILVDSQPVNTVNKIENINQTQHIVNFLQTEKIMVGNSESKNRTHTQKIQDFKSEHEEDIKFDKDKANYLQQDMKHGDSLPIEEIFEAEVVASPKVLDINVNAKEELQEKQSENLKHLEEIEREKIDIIQLNYENVESNNQSSEVDKSTTEHPFQPKSDLIKENKDTNLSEIKFLEVIFASNDENMSIKDSENDLNPICINESAQVNAEQQYDNEQNMENKYSLEVNANKDQTNQHSLTHNDLKDESVTEKTSADYIHCMCPENDSRFIEESNSADENAAYAATRRVSVPLEEEKSITEDDAIYSDNLEQDKSANLNEGTITENAHESLNEPTIFPKHTHDKGIIAEIPGMQIYNFKEENHHTDNISIKSADNKASDAIKDKTSGQEKSLSFKSVGQQEMFEANGNQTGKEITKNCIPENSELKSLETSKAFICQTSRLCENESNNSNLTAPNESASGYEILQEKNEETLEEIKLEETQDYFPSYGAVEYRIKEGHLASVDDASLRISGITGLKKFLKENENDISNQEIKAGISRLGHSPAIEKLKKLAP